MPMAPLSEKAAGGWPPRFHPAFPFIQPGREQIPPKRLQLGIILVHKIFLVNPQRQILGSPRHVKSFCILPGRLPCLQGIHPFKNLLIRIRIRLKRYGSLKKFTDKIGMPWATLL